MSQNVLWCYWYHCWQLQVVCDSANVEEEAYCRTPQPSIVIIYIYVNNSHRIIRIIQYVEWIFSCLSWIWHFRGRIFEISRQVEEMPATTVERRLFWKDCCLQVDIWLEHQTLHQVWEKMSSSHEVTGVSVYLTARWISLRRHSH